MQVGGHTSGAPAGLPSIEQGVNPLRQFVHVERFDHMPGKARLVRAFQVVRSPKRGHREGWDRGTAR